MSNYITKVIYEDGTELELGEIKPLIPNAADNFNEKYRKIKEYKRQHFAFETTILSNLDQDTVKDYSESEFDLIEEDDCDCDDITLSDFSRKEVIDEAKSYGTVIIQDSNLREDALVRKLLNLIKTLPIHEVEKIIENGS